MAARSHTFEVTGPGLEGRPVPCRGAAVAVALDRASRLEAPGTFYVRELGAIVARAEGDGQGRARLAGVDVELELELELEEV